MGLFGPPVQYLAQVNLGRLLFMATVCGLLLLRAAILALSEL
jgi:hypothetical protein